MTPNQGQRPQMTVFEHDVFAERAMCQGEGTADGSAREVELALNIGAADRNAVFVQWMVFVATQNNEAQNFSANEPVMA